MTEFQDLAGIHFSSDFWEYNFLIPRQTITNAAMERTS
jgi:hypothetical protein